MEISVWDTSTEADFGVDESKSKPGLMKETALKATETDPNVINPRRVRFQLCSEGWILRRLLLLADVLVVLARLLEGGGVTGCPRASATGEPPEDGACSAGAPSGCSCPSGDV